MDKLTDDQIIQMSAKLSVAVIALTRISNDQRLLIDSGTETIYGQSVSRAALNMKAFALEALEALVKIQSEMGPLILPEEITEPADKVFFDAAPPERFGWDSNFKLSDFVDAD